MQREEPTTGQVAAVEAALLMLLLLRRLAAVPLVFLVMVFPAARLLMLTNQLLVQELEQRALDPLVAGLFRVLTMETQ
jgi:hypothetical protein